MDKRLGARQSIKRFTPLTNITLHYGRQHGYTDVLTGRTVITAPEINC